MLDGKRVAVVVPAHDEERLIAETIGSIPDFVDRVYVVDDKSKDGTVAAVRALTDPRVVLIEHERNLGVGGAIITGYERARDDGIDVTAVMAADAQMDPGDLEKLVSPVARGEVDYAKANRLFTGQAWDVIPRYRYLGNAVLSMLTKIASGYWHVADSQSGYTAISLEYLQLLDLDRIYQRYGFPNDMLVHLNVVNARVRDYPSRPIYGVGERSGIRLRKVVPTISWLLFKGFWWRLREKYVIRDFHPLVFFYVLGDPDDRAGAGAGDQRGRLADPRQPDHGSYRGSRGVATDLRLPVHALRDVVRHGIEQGPGRPGPEKDRSGLARDRSLYRISTLRPIEASMAWFGEVESVECVGRKSPVNIKSPCSSSSSQSDPRSWHCGSPSGSRSSCPGRWRCCSFTSCSRSSASTRSAPGWTIVADERRSGPSPHQRLRSRLPGARLQLPRREPG